LATPPGGLIRLERVSRRQVVERLDLSDFRRHQLGCAACLLDGLPGLGQLDLFDSFGGDEERNSLAFQ
jgi:hypothetical protein